MSDLRVPPGQGSGVDDTYRMPRAVRAAQVIAVLLALIGLLCTASSGWLLGSRSAIQTAVPFIPGWLLGLVALTFNSEGQSVRIGAILLAVLNMLWTVPSITDGHPPGPLGPIASLVVIVLLFRREARDWFEPSGW
ncbi:hypothetical protein OHB26_13760 [Nocardia sp. NBC_01503]|uniref:hypothetical protein n=1 Tax=Nocardia sp. NBC_01503 TaxID=2975997 RepID=UPI002E7B25B3|nr:hypothetical protein [Nocardia sp. NBC_01503]WTL35163.1 hypothetical protein OHB26_13760 [Nocardia sp. NBC_01503]